MKYQPSLPEHNDNVSHDRPLREFFLLLAGLAAFALAVFWTLGFAVDWAVDHLSPETEARLSHAVAFKWKQEKPFSPDDQAMLQSIADELLPCTGMPYPATLHLIKADEINAVVFPGGHILVFSGLLDKMKSENGLSFVLAHEFSHLKNRDHLRGMGRSLLLILASTLLTGSHSDLTQLLLPVQGASVARYSQEREMAADSQALQILACRYGHAGGATEFFDMVKHETGVSAPGMSHYFSSHPELQARIDNLHRLMQERGIQQEAVLPLRESP